MYRIMPFLLLMLLLAPPLPVLAESSPAKTDPAATAAAKKKTTRILILGDSLTEGYGVPKAAAYPARLQELLTERKHKVEVINGGSSGSTSASALSRLRWHLKAKPDIMILALGANDGLRGIPVSSTEKNLGRTIKAAQEAGIRVILAGMKLPYNYADKYRSEFEAMFERLHKKHNTGFIPFLLDKVGGNPQYNLSDGIHPNERGHRQLAQTVLPHVEREL